MYAAPTLKRQLFTLQLAADLQAQQSAHQPWLAVLGVNEDQPVVSVSAFELYSENVGLQPLSC